MLLMYSVRRQKDVDVCHAGAPGVLAKYVVIRSVSGSSAPRLLLRSADGVLDLDGCCGWRNTAGEYTGADDDTDATCAYGGHRTGICSWLMDVSGILCNWHTDATGIDIDAVLS